MTKNHLDEVLSDVEKEYVKAFYDNSGMREAVKKVLLFDVYYNGTLEKGKAPDPMRNFLLGAAANNLSLKLTPEALGQDLLTQFAAINLLEMAFSNMSQYEDLPIERAQENPAR